MRALRESLKGERKNSRPQQISISTKSEIAALDKVVQANQSWNPQMDPELRDSRGKFLSIDAGDFCSVLRTVSNGDREYYELWKNDRTSGSQVQGFVPVEMFKEIPKQQSSAGLSTAGLSSYGTPSLPDSGYSTAPSYVPSDPGFTPKTPKHGRMSSMTRGAMVYGVVQYDFEAKREDELDAKAGESVIVIAQSNKEWFVAKPIGRLGGPGLLPVSYIEVRDMATHQAVSDPLKAVQAAGVPTVEEWKKLSAEYKNSSISLGQLTMPGQSTPTQGNGQQPQSPQYDSLQQLQQQQPQEQRQEQQRQEQQEQEQEQKQRQNQGIPTSACVPQYCFDNDKYWYIIECDFYSFDGSSHTKCRWALKRFYADFYVLQVKLIERFPDEAGTNGGTRILPYMPGPVTYVTDAISNGRRESLNNYVKELLALEPYISQCKEVLKFFGPWLTDEELNLEAVPEDYDLSDGSQRPGSAQNAQQLSREPSAQRSESNMYASQAQSNPWQAQQDSDYPSYSANSSQSNQNLQSTNPGNASTNQLEVKAEYGGNWFKVRCNEENTSWEELYSMIRSKIASFLKTNPQQHAAFMDRQFFDFSYEEPLPKGQQMGSPPQYTLSNDDYQLYQLLRQARENNVNLKLHMS